MENYPPVFIVGTPRSGTTLVRLILDSHFEIAITPESSFLFRVPDLWNGLYKNLNEEPEIDAFLDDLRRMPQIKHWLPQNCTARILKREYGAFSDLSELINAIFSFYAGSKGKKRWGDKTPKNLHAIDHIMSLFPNAVIVNVVRDCRDVAMSLGKADFSSASHIVSALRWQKDAELFEKYKKKFPEQVFSIQYEKLINEPERTIAYMLKKCGLNPDPDILERYGEHEDDVAHTKSSLYMRPLSTESLYKWKKRMPPGHIRDCESIAHRGLSQFGYELFSNCTKLNRYKKTAHCIKSFFTLLLNKKNMENYYSFGCLTIKKQLKNAYVPTGLPNRTLWGRIPEPKR